MFRSLLRLVFLTLVASLLVAPPALAGCATDPTAPGCMPTSPPKPPPTMQPQPTQAPPVQQPAATPRPSSKPKAKTTTTTRATEAPAVIEVTPEPTPIEPTFTPEIVVPTAAPETAAPLAAKNTGGNTPAAWWAFLIAGILIGWIGGMVTSGTVRRRRKKQAIFG